MGSEERRMEGEEEALMAFETVHQEKQRAKAGERMLWLQGMHGGIYCDGCALDHSPKTITILVVDNSTISPLSSLSANILKKVISIHAILDYYDPNNLDQLPNTALLPTLFQASGLATNQMGFLDYTKLPGKQMVFSSAAPRAPLNSNVLKVVAARPYDISVLQISTVIVPPSIKSSTRASPTPAAATPKEVPVQKPVATPHVAAPKASAAAQGLTGSANDEKDADASTASPVESEDALKTSFVSR
ncbi:fasciclin-like arabinogalactan protein [Musa troglodytarum]|uniref:Fasciclin-like arabinogalactan protein n=1 Tax=Musa troglodytarum TaxID=320322 RepID=A0A9E7G608_9LILI|nr:fasciclin-like arabinogalactan protein [Musa troglodytarum]